MSDDPEADKDDVKARYEAKLDWLSENGFNRSIIRLGGGMFDVFGGIDEAALCLRCFCLVPIADLTNATTTIDRHAALPHPAS